MASTANQPPACQRMTLSQTSNIPPSGTFTVTTDFVDPENDLMTFNIMLNEKYINGSTSFSNARFKQTGAQTVLVAAPTTAGVWKIYVYAFDGHNDVGIESASFAVQ